MNLRHVLVFSGVVACSSAFWQNAAKVATEVANCVAPIVLDVTGLATEDPVQIAAQCAVAVVDVYNWVTAAINSAQIVDAGASIEGGAAMTVTRYQVKSGNAFYYCTAAQFSRLQRIQAAANKFVDVGIQ